jgi:hypothetical protein
MSHIKSTDLADSAKAGDITSCLKMTEVTVPLKTGTSNETISKNIRELHKGDTYKRTAAKFGAEKAKRQAVAIALSQARKSGARINKK